MLGTRAFPAFDFLVRFTSLTKLSFPLAGQVPDLPIQLAARYAP